MNPTKIEWTNYTWNPITGCSRGCSYCYAERMAKRLAGRNGYSRENPFKPTFHPERLHEPSHLRRPSMIFTCSMGELFDPKVNDLWIADIAAEMLSNPRHIFQVLTKRPERIQWLPDNCWLGVSIDGVNTGCEEVRALRAIHHDGLKFVSFEPLLDEVYPDLDGIGWIIIGACTGPKAEQPEDRWILALIEEAREHDIPVFLKNNLTYWQKIQEFPGGG